MKFCVNLKIKTEKFYITLSKLQGSRGYDRAAIATKNYFALNIKKLTKYAQVTKRKQQGD